jgi:hypothetical protein
MIPLVFIYKKINAYSTLNNTFFLPILAPCPHRPVPNPLRSYPTIHNRSRPRFKEIFSDFKYIFKKIFSDFKYIFKKIFSDFKEIFRDFKCLKHLSIFLKAFGPKIHF